MNSFNERLSKFKQELIPILYLSSIQVWWNFNFPLFIRQGPCLGLILAISASIIGITCIVFLFSFADKLAPYLNLNYLNAMPYGHILKKIEMTMLIVAIFFGTFFAWYKNIYGMSNMYYAISYVHFLVMFVLLYRALYRVPIQNG